MTLARDLGHQIAQATVGHFNVRTGDNILLTPSCLEAMGQFCLDYATQTAVTAVCAYIDAEDARHRERDLIVAKNTKAAAERVIASLDRSKQPQD